MENPKNQTVQFNYVFGLALLTGAVTLFSATMGAAATTPVAQLSPAKASTKLPPGLQWKSDKLQVVSRVRGKKLRTYAVLRGFYQQKGWQLKINKKERLRMSKDKGRFALAVRLEGAKTPITVSALGPKGEKVTYQANVIFNGYDEYQSTHAPENNSNQKKASSAAAKPGKSQEI